MASEKNMFHMGETYDREILVVDLRMCNAQKQGGKVGVESEKNLKYTIRSTYKILRDEVGGEEEVIYTKLWRFTTLHPILCMKSI